MAASGRPILTEEERLARHILEQEGDDVETRNNIRKFVRDEPVSHYECKWVSENPIIPAWEDVDEIKETYERPPDHIGCLHCGIMNDMDETLLGKEIWQHYILNNLDTKDWQNYDGLRYIL